MPCTGIRPADRAADAAGSFLSSVASSPQGSARCPRSPTGVVPIELLRAAAELRFAVPQEVAQPIHLRQRMVARGDRSAALYDRSAARVAATNTCSASNIGRKVLRIGSYARRSSSLWVFGA